MTEQQFIEKIEQVYKIRKLNQSDYRKLIVQEIDKCFIELSNGWRESYKKSNIYWTTKENHLKKELIKYVRTRGVSIANNFLFELGAEGRMEFYDFIDDDNFHAILIESIEDLCYGVIKLNMDTYINIALKNDITNKQTHKY